MNIYPCKLICKYKEPPFREIVLSNYVLDEEKAIAITEKFISENAYSVHDCSLFLVDGKKRNISEYSNGHFNEINSEFSFGTCN